MRKTIITTITLIAIATGQFIYTNGFETKLLYPFITFTLAVLVKLFPRVSKSSTMLADSFTTQISKILLATSLFLTAFIGYSDVFSDKIYGNVTIRQFIIATIIFFITYATSKTISNHVILSNRQDKTITIKMRVIHYIIVFTALMATLKYLGLSAAVTNILLAGSITSIVIGLAAQKTIGNFIAGIILLMDKPFKIGDYIEVQNIQGYVIDVQFMSTIIKTLDEEIVRIPNELILTERVTNYKKNKIIRVMQKVGISYDSDIETAKKAILEALDEEEYVLMYPEPFISVSNYGDSAIEITFWYYVPFDEYYTTPKRVLENIKKKFNEYGITIPFPQLVVHSDEAIKVEVGNAFIQNNKQ